MKKITDTYPFYLPLFAVCIGFVLCEFSFLTVPFLVIVFGTIFILIVQNRYRYYQYFIYTALLFTVLGFIRYFQNQETFNKDLKATLQSKHLHLLISQNLGKRKNWFRYECKVLESSLDGVHWNQTIDAHVDFYFKDSSFLDEGHSFVLTNVRLVPYDSSVLPGEFNLRKLKFSRKFVALCFAKNANLLHSSISVNAIYSWRSKVKNKLNSSLKAGLSGPNLMLVRQLIWGDKTLIDEDLKYAFQISGTTHVLSVSGMHMALLFAFIHFILDKLSRKKHIKRWLKLGIIPILWIYAFFTGFSAPVLRAVSFFTYYLIGNVLFYRSLKLLHVLMVVGIIQLLIDPFSLYDIGFQLSYLAVFGLSVILPFLKSYYEGFPVFWKYILDAFAISLSSTITTYPLVLYYFHQFSVWFLLGNLLLLPLFTILMYALFLLVFLAIFNVKLAFVIPFINQYLNIVATVVKWSIQLPCPFIFSFGFNEWMMLLHFVFLHLIVTQFHKGLRFFLLLFTLLLCSNFLALFWFRKFKNQSLFEANFKFFGGQVTVLKSARTLKITADSSVPQNLLNQKLEYLLKSRDIDTIFYTFQTESK